jgi:putative transposase
MKRFKSARQVQRFLSAHDPINNLFLLPRLSRKLCLRESHHMSATEYSAARAQAFEAWHQVCGIKLAAFRLSNLIGHRSNTLLL